MTKKKPSITEVPDFNGTPTRVGDRIVYISKTYCTSELAFGTVVGFSKVFGKTCVIVEDEYGFESKPTSQSFYRIGDGDA